MIKLLYFMGLLRYFHYACYVLTHKLYVFEAGRALGVPLWQLLLHDWSKFLPGEFIPYAKTFYAEDGSKQHETSPEYYRAWCEHENRNKHHWGHWLVTIKGTIIPLEIPENHVREMVADWVGAGEALGKPDTLGWYEKHKNDLILGKDTRILVEDLLYNYVNR